MVSCSFEDLYLGMRVEVVFEQHEDVWLPLFKPCAVQPPAPAPLPSDEIPPSSHWKHVRPMVSSSKFEDSAAITGIGQSEIGRRLMRSPLSLAVDACSAAVDDAGLAFEDIDGIAVYPGVGVDLRRAREAGPDQDRWRAGDELDVPVRRDVRGSYPGADRAAVLRRLRGVAGDAGVDRAEPAC
jgi:hypothetical protein